jgi:DNA-binding transcriptional LysR family regulator
MESDSHDTVKAAVQSGLGVGFFYRDNVALGLKEGYLKTIDIPLLKQKEVKRYIIYRRGTHLSRNAKDFLAFLHRWPPMPSVGPGRDIHKTPLTRVRKNIALD